MSTEGLTGRQRGRILLAVLGKEILEARAAKWKAERKAKKER